MNTSLWLLGLLCLAGAANGRTLLQADGDCAIAGNCGPKTPAYNTTGTHGATEIREYENGTWAVSFGRSKLGVDVAAAYATKALVKYFLGENNQHLEIPPSIPLINTVLAPPHHPPHKKGGKPHHHDEHEKADLPLDAEFDQEDSEGKKPHNGSHPHPPHPPHHPPGPLVVSGAWIPIKENIPRPDNRHIKLVRTNTTKVYVHRFGGWAISWVIPKEIKHLTGDLKELGIKPCKGKFLVATYDPPLKLFGRKNEIWWTELPKRPHHHHNKTVEYTEDGFAIGFEAMDPMMLFPEESRPEPIEDTEQALDDNEQSVDNLEGEFQDSLGEWSTSSGKPVEQIFETS